MSTLFAALGTAGQSLEVLERAIGTVQNNIANASTPGYVTQTLQINAGITGGIEAGDFDTSRSFNAENAVWSVNEQLGSATQQATNLSSLQNVFDVTGKTGIPAALTTLYSAFSAWSSSPEDSTARNQVLSAAQGVAQSFNTASRQIAAQQSQANTQIDSVVSQINTIASQLTAINASIRKGGEDTASLDSSAYNDLEQLSNLSGISVRKESDGTFTVLLGGQVPLVIGESQTTIKAVPGSASVALETSAGQDFTAKVNGGQLDGLLQFTNTVLPSIAGNARQQGSLNELAQNIADHVNTLLTSGQTASGASGVPLFSYTSGLPSATAGTLSVSSSITASQLAAVNPGPPSVANGIANELAGLATSSSSYSDRYSQIASGVGTLQSAAAATQTSQTQLLAQTQAARSQISGVSLNDQATQLLEFQQSYQACAETLSTVSKTISSLLATMQALQ